MFKIKKMCLLSGNFTSNLYFLTCLFSINIINVQCAFLKIQSVNSISLRYCDMNFTSNRQ